MRYNFTHDDLKECPFCGNTIYVEVEKKIVQTVNQNYRQEWEARWNVRCTNPVCPVQPKTTDFASLSEAVEAWNKRNWPLPPTATAVLRDCYGNWYDVTGKLVKEYREGQP